MDRKETVIVDDDRNIVLIIDETDMVEGGEPLIAEYSIEEYNA